MNIKADFYIERIRHHKDTGELLGYLVRENNEDGTTTRLIMQTRSMIVENIHAGMKYLTLQRDPVTRDWGGSNVNLVMVDNNPFLRIDLNQKASDNLGTLPEG